MLLTITGLAASFATPKLVSTTSGARYYGNTFGRFTQPDWSAKAEGVPYANFSNPQTINLYGYVRDCPVCRADPNGHETPIVEDPVKIKDVGDRFTKNVLQPIARHPQVALGVAEIGAAALTFGASVPAFAAATTVTKGLAAGAETLAATGAVVSGSSRLIGTATNTDPEKIETGASAAGTVTNPIALETAILSGGNMKAGQVAGDVASAGKLVKAPGEEIKKNAADAGLTVNNVAADIKDAATSVSNWFHTPNPPAPPPPPPPPPSTQNKQQ